ncbi:MAG: 50S ribosomal protein L24 [Pirellulales bacterium]|nr:50S ribosomal protein L24 [Pirellulales bacterium]
MAIRIKVGDMVKVLAGNDRNDQGRVTSINHATRTLIVEGMNKVKKSVRRSQKNPQGGKLEKEMPLPICRVQFVCPSCGEGTRLGARVSADKSKVRYCRKCKWEEEISPARSN